MADSSKQNKPKAPKPQNQGNNNASENKEKKSTPKPKADQPESAASQSNNQATGTQQTNTQPKGEGKEKKEKKSQPKTHIIEKRRGICKAVISGDTFTIMPLEGASANTSQWKDLTLTKVEAPKLGKKPNPEKNEPGKDDEDFAWESREFLRKEIIGKPLIYMIEFQAGNRNYAKAFISEEGGEVNVAAKVIENGWASVKKPVEEGRDNKELEELIEIEENAKRNGRGKWSKNKEFAKRDLKKEVNLQDVFAEFKGVALDAVLESVIYGHLIRVSISKPWREFVLQISGVTCPKSKQGKWDQFGPEAKFLTEYLLLNQTVRINLEGVDRTNLYGTVSLPGKGYIAEELLRNGLGTYVEWSGARTAIADRLKAAEKSAQEKNLRLWSVIPIPTPTNASGAKKSKTGRELVGKVVDITSSGFLEVLDGNNHSHRITFSSLRLVRPPITPVPRRGAKATVEPTPETPAETTPAAANNSNNNNNKADPSKRPEDFEKSLAYQWREFLRQRLIGQKVKCIFDYARSNQRNNDKNKTNAKPAEETQYYSIYLDKVNVGVELAEAGLGEVLEPRSGEARSRDYELLMFAETRAKEGKKGMWCPPDRAAKYRIRDLSMDGKAARDQMPTYRKNGKMRGIVEHEFSGHKFKLIVPKENAQIMFALSGLKTPNAVRNEEYATEALALVKSMVHLREVEFDVVGMDKVGAYLGTMWVNKEPIGVRLLEEGYGELLSSYKDLDVARAYITAEEGAKRAKKNIWKNWDEEAAKEKARIRREESEENSRGKPSSEIRHVTVTEIIDAAEFFVQETKADELKQLEELMAALNGEEGVPPVNPSTTYKKGEMVRAQFSADDKWYRARVTQAKSAEEIHVFYVDYGNSEIVSATRLRPLEKNFTALKELASRARLAYVVPPRLESDYGLEAAEAFKDLVEGKVLEAHVERKDGDLVHLVLIAKEDNIDVNNELVRQGLARLERSRGRVDRERVEAYRAEQEKARTNRYYIWEYGDPGSDDE